MGESETLRLDADLSRRIEELARATGVEPAQLIREVVGEYCRSAEQNGGGSARTASTRLSDLAASIAATVPAEDWDELPADLARDFEHHRYGYPRED
jgi:hypothetical protein